VTAPSLTPRERQILGFIAEGMTAGRIAHRLQIAERTVEKHTSNLYRKLNVSSRADAVRRGAAAGLLGPTPRTGLPGLGSETYSR
jgi:DNA-binding NarL/FixJ family response regulator